MTAPSTAYLALAPPGVADRAVGVVLLLAGASLAWWVLRSRAKHFRSVRNRPAPDSRLASADLGSGLGAVGTFVQFSAATCATCPQVHRLLTDVAADTPGIVHIELAAEAHLDLVRRWSIFRTPTVLLLDPAGNVHSRMSGPLTRASALAALGQLTSAAPRSIHA